MKGNRIYTFLLLIGIFLIVSCNPNANNQIEPPTTEEVSALIENFSDELIKLSASYSQPNGTRKDFTAEELRISEAFIGYPANDTSVIVFDRSITQDESFSIAIGPDSYYTDKIWYQENGAIYLSKAVIALSSLYGYPISVGGVEYDYSKDSQLKSYSLTKASFDNSSTNWIKDFSGDRVSMEISSTMDPVVCSYSPDLSEGDTILFLTIEDKNVISAGIVGTADNSASFYTLPYSPTGYDPAKSGIKTYQCLVLEADGTQKGVCEITFDITYIHDGNNDGNTIIPDAPETLSSDLLMFSQALIASIRNESIPSGSLNSENLSDLINDDVFSDFGIPAAEVDSLVLFDKSFNKNDLIMIKLADSAEYEDVAWTISEDGYLLINRLALIINDALGYTARINSEIIDYAVYDRTGIQNIKPTELTFSINEGNSYNYNGNEFDITVGTPGTSVTFEYNSTINNEDIIFSAYSTDNSNEEYRIGKLSDTFVPIQEGADILEYTEYSFTSSNTVIMPNSNDIHAEYNLDFNVIPNKEYVAAEIMASFINGMNKDKIIAELQYSFNNIDWNALAEQLNFFQILGILSGSFDLSDLTLTQVSDGNILTFDTLSRVVANSKTENPDPEYITVDLSVNNNFSGFFDESSNIIILKDSNSQLTLSGTCSNGTEEHPTMGKVVTFSLSSYSFATPSDYVITITIDDKQYSLSFDSINGNMDGILYLDPKMNGSLEAQAIINDFAVPVSATNLAINGISIDFDTVLDIVGRT